MLKTISAEELMVPFKLTLCASLYCLYCLKLNHFVVAIALSKIKYIAIVGFECMRKFYQHNPCNRYIQCLVSNDANVVAMLIILTIFVSFA